jgi:hypothetical protein
MDLVVSIVTAGIVKVVMLSGVRWFWQHGHFPAKRLIISRLSAHEVETSPPEEGLSDRNPRSFDCVQRQPVAIESGI